MKYPIAERLNKLSHSLESLKEQVREAMAGELAKAVGAAVRDVMIVVLCDQFAHSTSYRSTDPYAADERDEWDEDYPGTRSSSSSVTLPPIPTAAAVAVGVHVGRWLFRRQGSLPLSLGAGVLTTMFGMSGGPAIRAILSVVSASVDLLNADRDLDH